MKSSPQNTSHRDIYSNGINYSLDLGLPMCISLGRDVVSIRIHLQLRRLVSEMQMRF